MLHLFCFISAAERHSGFRQSSDCPQRAVLLSCHKTVKDATIPKHRLPGIENSVKALCAYTASPARDKDFMLSQPSRKLAQNGMKKQADSRDDKAAAQMKKTKAWHQITHASFLLYKKRMTKISAVFFHYTPGKINILFLSSPGS